MSIDPIGAQVKYDNRRRIFWVDLAIFFALIIVLLEQHPLSGEQKRCKTKPFGRTSPKMLSGLTFLSLCRRAIPKTH